MCLGLAACGDLPTPFKGNPGATAMRLAQPPPPLLAVVPAVDPALPAPVRAALGGLLAAELQKIDVPAQAKVAQKTEWHLVTRAEHRDGAVVPIFIVRDPAGADQGMIEGTPVPDAVVATSGADLGGTIALDAAPIVSALLTNIRIGRDKADPTSLYNRPAKAFVAEVTGAPGDGNQALTRQLRARLDGYGLVLQPASAGADFEVRGDVSLAPEPKGRQRIEIVWTVLNGKGDERGKVVQLNEIPAGSLDHYWGDVAVVVGAEAAGGIADVIAKQSGRTNAPVQAAAETPAAAPAESPAEVAGTEPLPEPPRPPATPPPRPKKKRAGG